MAPCQRVRSPGRRETYCGDHESGSWSEMRGQSPERYHADGGRGFYDLGVVMEQPLAAAGERDDQFPAVRSGGSRSQHAGPGRPAPVGCGGDQWRACSSAVSTQTGPRASAASSRHAGSSRRPRSVGNPLSTRTGSPSSTSGRGTASAGNSAQRVTARRPESVSSVSPRAPSPRPVTFHPSVRGKPRRNGSARP